MAHHLVRQPQVYTCCHHLPTSRPPTLHAAITDLTNHIHPASHASPARNRRQYPWKYPPICAILYKQPSPTQLDRGSQR